MAQKLIHRPHYRPHTPEADMTLDFARPPSGYDPDKVNQFLDASNDLVEQNLAAQTTYTEVIAANSEILNLGKAALAEDLDQEETVREAFCQFLGKISLRQTVEVKKEAAGPTLAMSITETNKGNKEAEARVDINVGTATTEGYFKEGHITRVEKEVNDHGEVVQFGLTTESMHHDSLVLRPNRPEELKKFTLAEARNGFREQELAGSGQLKDGFLVVASCVPENLPEEDLDYRGDGYFTRSMTCAMQGTTMEGGDIITETVFAKGTDADESAYYELRQSMRFDIAAIGKVYERFGLEAPKTALEMLERPLWIPKDKMPNGMVDFWRWVDEAADELRAVKIARDPQQYIERIAQSREREASLANAKRQIKQDLLALDGTFSNDMDAINALWELVKNHGVQESAINENINPMVFGARAAVRIERARYYASIGDINSMNRWLRSAQRVAQVSGCGGGAGGRKNNSTDTENLDMQDDQQADNESDGSGDKKWHWKKGICRVDSCSSRPGTTMVGPCSVCRGCQKKFDQGLDPTKISVPKIEKYDAVADLLKLLRGDNKKAKGKKGDYSLAA